MTCFVIGITIKTFFNKAPETRLWVSRYIFSAHNEATYFIIHYPLFDYISLLYIMLGIRQCQIMES